MSMSGQQQRLESWKQIAAYLGKSERTARRWQQTEDMPVHRHQHHATGIGVGVCGGDESAAIRDFLFQLAGALASVTAKQLKKEEARAGTQEKRRRKAETIRFTNGRKQRWF